jgi:hypothetical protein
MIIDTNTRISPGLLQTTQSKPNKSAARAKSESSAAASPESDTSSPATLAAQNVASAISPIEDA